MPKGKKIRKRAPQSAEPSRLVWILLGFTVLALLVGTSLVTFLSQRNWVLPWQKAPALEYKTAVLATPKAIAPEFLRKSSSLSSKDTETSLGLIAAYLRRNGGKETLDPLKTLLIKGKLTYDGHAYDFEMLKKTPNKLRIQLLDKKGVLIVASNGKQAWEGFRAVAGTVHWWPIKDNTADWLWLQSPLGGWLMQPMSAEIPITLGAKKPAAADGPILQPLSINSTGGRQIVYYLDADEYLPRHLELLDKDPSAPVQSADFGNVSLVGGVWLPHIITSNSSTGIKTTLEVSKVAFNSGVFNDTFEPPPGVEPTQSASATPGSLNSPPDLSTYGFPWALPW